MLPGRFTGQRWIGVMINGRMDMIAATNEEKMTKKMTVEKE